MVFIFILNTLTKIHKNVKINTGGRKIIELTHNNAIHLTVWWKKSNN